MRLERMPPSVLDADQAALYGEITGGPRGQGPQHFALTAPDGSLNGPFNALLLSPVLGRALQGVGAAVRYQTELSDREREIAILLVAAHWHSAFEQHAHESVGRSIGLTDDELATLRRSELPYLADEHERLCAEATLALLAGDLSDDEWEGIAVPLGNDTVFELTTLVGYYATLALQLRVFRVTTEDD